jgi:hypothetical protein
VVSDREDYTPADVIAARAVLVMVAELFQDLSDELVLVGGWVPPLLIAGAEDEHVGSLDVDLAFREAGAAIDQRLRDSGFYPDPREAFRYWKTIDEILIPVDILAPNPPPGPKPKGPLRSGLRPFVTPASALALDDATLIDLTPTLKIRVASIVPFLVMKAKAFANRAPKKTKDAYDIYFCVKHFPGGVEAIARAFEPFLTDPLVVDAISILSNGFDSVAARGCRDVSEFLDDEDTDLLKRDVYERMNALLGLIT